MAPFKHLAAALALALAAPVSAQAPAPQAQQAPSQPRLTAEQQAALGAVWAYYQLESGLGDIAAKRGSSQEVKDFAKRIGDDHKRLAGFLEKALQARGVSPSSLPQPPDRQQLEQEARQLASRSGDDFDRALVAFMKQHGETFVDALKRAREATPGSDADLKKLLDDSEDPEEAYLTSARQLDARRVQARTPPGR